MLIRLLIILSLIAATGFLLLKFFSRLADVDMLAAMNWAFHAKSQPGNAVILLPVAVIFCHILSFIFLYLYFYVFPVRTYQMDKYHAGGLLGYNEGKYHMVYNPSRGEYTPYFWYDAPPPAVSFTRAFEVVSFFKLPSNDYYQGTMPQHWASRLPVLFFGLLFLAGEYLVLYVLAQNYAGLEGPQNRLTHHFIASQFRSIAGISPFRALIIFLAIAALFFAWSFIFVKKVTNRCRDLYAPHQQELRSELLEKISPGDTLTGLVISGYKYTESEDADHDDGKAGRHYRRYTGYSYDVEFRGLMRIPVYLTFKSREAKGNVDEAGSQSLDAHVDPDFLKEYEFTVNPDYSVSFKSEKIEEVPDSRGELGSSGE